MLMTKRKDSVALFVITQLILNSKYKFMKERTQGRNLTNVIFVINHLPKNQVGMHTKESIQNKSRIYVVFVSKLFHTDHR